MVVVEGDAQSHLHAPAVDAELLDQKTQQLLASLEVESVATLQDAPAEDADPLPQAILLCELSSLPCKLVPLPLELGTACLHFLRPTLQLDKLDEAGLVEVDEPAAFRACRSRTGAR